MYTLTRFEIDGFWNTHSIQVDLQKDVNIFIGYNGTGKTTMINVLQAALTVDVGLLHTLTFDEIRLFLKDGSSSRKIIVTSLPSDSAYDFVKYKIGRQVYEIPLVSHEFEMRRRLHSRYVVSIQKIRKKLDDLVEVSWLSVHRQLIQDDDIMDRAARRRSSDHILNPVDSRLNHLLSRLSEYHLGLQVRANEISVKFQKDVLVSLLYSSEFDTFNVDTDEAFDFEEMRDQLHHAFDALGIKQDSIKKRINEHTESIKKSITTIKKQTENNESHYVNDVLPYSLFKRTLKIVESSNEADAEKKKLFELLNLFVSTINNFFDGKSLILAPDQEYGLKIRKENEDLEFELLSSGEKQLFILLAETVLQNQMKSIFVADEPELSLHVVWQQNLLKAVRELNPNAQLIVATHSPEIAGPWRKKLINMREIIL